MHESACAGGTPTRFEAMVLHSVRDALSRTDIDVSDSKVLLVLSTTKGNIELLDGNGSAGDALFPGTAASRIASELGFVAPPLVVSNACISGVAAQVQAMDLLDSGAYDYAVVVGADCQGAFIVSGFNCLKALSEDPCRPFDMERMGLNLGEAAATIVFASDRVPGTGVRWNLKKGCVRNDAFHITNPSPKGEGCFRALEHVSDGIARDTLATIGAHGTATMYNDQMESVAIDRAGLSDVPLSALKGYFGHTMGAAGLLETILTMETVARCWIPGVLGYEECGVSGRINASAGHQPTDKRTFIKMMSGFGGCNAALLFTMDDEADVREQGDEGSPDCIRPAARHCIRIMPDSVEVDGKVRPTGTHGADMLSELYRSLSADYPRFYRMDMLSRLGFIAVELLLREAGETMAKDCDMFFFNRSSSVISDRKHQQTISRTEAFFPSPATFVYTLPNIMLGEVAIRHGITGSTSLCILQDKNVGMMSDVINAHMMSSSRANGMIAGWIDCPDENEFEAEISLYIKNIITMEELIQELKERIIQVLNLEELTPEDIDAEAPLFGEGLGLDSIDALELIVLMEKYYGIRLATASEAKPIFKSLNTMAAYIAEHRTK